MKKIIILLITSALLTGCQTTYNINIKEQEIEDSISVFTNNKNVQNATKETMDDFLDELMNFERGYEYYKRTLYTEEQNTGYNYTYNFKYDEYDAMSQIRKCYEKFEFKSDNIITIKTSKEFLCGTYYPDITNIKISITSDYRITQSNADIKENNTHTWLINKKNYKNKPIEIQLNKSIKQNKNENEKQNNKSKIIIKMIITAVVFLILLTILIINNKNKKQR